MDDKDRQSAFLSALVTEHFVLQTAASATVTEAASRSSLYVFSLSSSLVAMGFASRSREAFLPFAVTLLSGVFLLGVLRSSASSTRCSNTKDVLPESPGSAATTAR